MGTMVLDVRYIRPALHRTGLYIVPGTKDLVVRIKRKVTYQSSMASCAGHMGTIIGARSGSPQLLF